MYVRTYVHVHTVLAIVDLKISQKIYNVTKIVSWQWTLSTSSCKSCVKAGSQYDARCCVALHATNAMQDRN